MKNNRRIIIIYNIIAREHREPAYGEREVDMITFSNGQRVTSSDGSYRIMRNRKTASEREKEHTNKYKTDDRLNTSRAK